MRHLSAPRWLGETPPATISWCLESIEDIRRNGYGFISVGYSGSRRENLRAMTAVSKMSPRLRAIGMVV
jgi:hypothetical protein